MHNYGFVKCAAASIPIKIADCKHNYNEIIKKIDEAEKNNVEVLVFPELCISGYTCADLFFQKALLDMCEESIAEISEYLKDKEMIVAVGAPVEVNDSLYNCAVIISKGEILGIVPKTYLPNYNEFYEERWFASANEATTEIFYAGQNTYFGNQIIFEHETLSSFKIGVEICEDLWAPIPPSKYLALNGATMILNLSASNEVIGKKKYRSNLIKSLSASVNCAYIYADASWGESTTDTVFAGDNYIAENGTIFKNSSLFVKEGTIISAHIDTEKLVNERIKSNTFAISKKEYASNIKRIKFNTNPRFNDIDYPILPHPFIPNDEAKRNKICSQILNIQSHALAQRLNHIGANNMVIGISGGLDSTLALLVCSKACEILGLEKSNINAITMPGFGTTNRTYENAVSLIKAIGATFKEISIKEACLMHFKDIGQNPDKHDSAYENAQARERTQILMDIANQTGGIVVGTGDLSELALGWATYNGDHMSMYGVNGGVPKTLIKYILKWAADNTDQKLKKYLYDVIDTPISPELLPPDENGIIQQKTEDSVGKYELQDFFLYNVIRYGFSPKKILFLATEAFKEKYEKEYILDCLKLFYKRFFNNQFKRSCLPDGPKIGSITLSPRADWRMPSDSSYNLWVNELESLQ